MQFQTYMNGREFVISVVDIYLPTSPPPDNTANCFSRTTISGAFSVQDKYSTYDDSGNYFDSVLDKGDSIFWGDVVVKGNAKFYGTVSSTTTSFTGPTGYTGPQGPAGPQGLQGLQGQNVTVVPITEDEEDCGGRGGVRLVGTTTAVVCNGSGGGGSGIIGTGYVNVGSCDSSVKITLESAYNDGEFKMSAINFQKLAGACDEQELTVILKIRSSIPPDELTRTYQSSDVIRCTKILALDPLSGIDANSLRLGENECEGSKTPSGTFYFEDVYAQDISSSARGLLIQIAAKP
jgi:hypothetical protein